MRPKNPRRHSMPIKIALCDSPGPSANSALCSGFGLTLRQPSFSSLIATKETGCLQTKDGESVDNDVIVYDTEKALPLSASTSLFSKSLYGELSNSKGPSKLTLDIDLPLGSDCCEEDEIPINSLSSFYPRDRKSQIMRKLMQINASRWEDIGYTPETPTLNTFNFQSLLSV